MASRTTVGYRLTRWWRRLTLPQAIAFVAGGVALYLLRGHFPTDPDSVKEWLEVVAYGGTVLATLGALAHGREAPARDGGA